MAHWKHFTSRDQNKVEDFVNQHKPNKDGLVALLSHGEDFHVWVRISDHFSKRWELKHMGSWQDDISSEEFGTMINGGKVVPVGFNISRPPSVWYFEHE